MDTKNRMENITLIALENSQNLETFEEFYQNIEFQKLPEKYRYKFSWNTYTMKNDIKIQKQYWKFWKTELSATIQPKDNTLPALFKEIKTVGNFLATRLDRKLFNEIVEF